MMAKVLPGLDSLLIDELPDNMSTVTKDMQKTLVNTFDKHTPCFQCAYYKQRKHK